MREREREWTGLSLFARVALGSWLISHLLSTSSTFNPREQWEHHKCSVEYEMESTWHVLIWLLEVDLHLALSEVAGIPAAEWAGEMEGGVCTEQGLGKWLARVSHHKRWGWDFFGKFWCNWAHTGRVLLQCLDSESALLNKTSIPSDTGLYCGG